MDISSLSPEHKALLDLLRDAIVEIEEEKGREIAEKIISEGKALGEQARKEMITKASEESNQIVKRAQEQIALEKERAISELRERIADLSIAAASKVIDRSLSKEDHMELLEEYISSIGDLNVQ